MKDVRKILALSTLALAIVGCQSGDTVGTGGGAPSGGASAVNSRPVDKPDAEAGVQLGDSKADPQRYASLTGGRNFGGMRTDPFALRPSERAYDASQLTEKLTGEFAWGTEFPEEKEPEVDERPEPQPYRRLAGVIIGESISAIIIMENGRAEHIRPGMQIPNSEWTVVSIDEDKAILRRGGAKKPHQIIVNLEGAPAIGNSGGGGRGNNSGGGGRGGRQGGPGLGTSGG